MKLLIRLSVLALLGYGGAVYSQSEALPSGLPGIDGLAPALQAPSVEGGTGLLRDDSLNLPLLKRQPSVSPQAIISGGVPGIDGLNFSPEALRKAFRGLDPALVRAVLGDSNPQLIQQITQDLATQLPGLGDDNNSENQTLPGLDGLPIDLPK